jgi:proline utilization trans-activator
VRQFIVYDFLVTKTIHTIRYIKKLEGEVRDLRAQQLRLGAASPSETTYEAPSVTNDQDQNPAQFTDADVSNPLLESPTGFVAAGSLSPPVYIGETSCVAFGDTLLQCVDKDTDLALWPPPTYFQHEIFNRLVRSDIILPDRIQSRLLVGVAVRFIGTDYHLLLKKTFYEKLDRICAGEEAQDLVWMCKCFILLALGEMYSNRQRRDSNQRVPGTDYFLQATGLLQDLYETPSVEQVEVLILFVSAVPLLKQRTRSAALTIDIQCFYANALGRTKSAYTYIGIAMRMALALGLHRNLPTDTMLNPVEREHRKRVWWTLYTLDRLCCSILGYPLLISDSLIDVELPTDQGLSVSEQEEFSDPAHLIATIKLARITGQIRTSQPPLCHSLPN